jgi:hypothetical protein
MFNWIEVNVVGAALEISIVTNGMLPKALLPKRVFASMVA